MVKTCLIKIKETIDYKLLFQVAEDLVKGALVGMPTETVYGLAANALLAEAVSRIFTVKGRPQDNPLIVHFYDKNQLLELIDDLPENFTLLYQAFCPGPLTMIIPKAKDLPSVVTSGLETMAVRFPSQRTARALIKLAKVPVVAPSGNLSGRPSPTRASHMLDDLEGKIEYILDDGPSDLGVESTVLDLCSDPPLILRPGVISKEDIVRKTGLKVDYCPDIFLAAEENQAAIRQDEKVDLDFKPRSPGQKYRHYAPKAKLLIARGKDEKERVDYILARADQLAGKNIGFFGSELTYQLLKDKLAAFALEGKIAAIEASHLYPGPANTAAATHELFFALRFLDAQDVDIILAEELGQGDYKTAYMNRLERAAKEE